MTQYVFTLTSRMVAIFSACVVFLGILLFLLGVEIGKLWTIGNPVVQPARQALQYPLPERSAGTATPKSAADLEQN